MLIKIWERYFLKQFLQMFCLFLICFYGLYIIIDYSTHANTFSHSNQVSWVEIIRYYLFIFASRAEVLLPLALLVAFVQTVCKLNRYQEFVALMASGFNPQLLMRPFLGMGFICVFLMYANEQFFLPEALKKLRRIEDATKHQKNHHMLPLTVRHVILEDGSLLIFQKYDNDEEQFFDVYWIQSIDHIYRIKLLSPTSPPIGFWVDHLARQPDNELLQIASYPEFTFPQMKFNPERLQSTILEPDIFSITDLTLQAPEKNFALNEKESKVLTALYWKLFIPWLCLFAIIAPAPYCIKFSRQQPIFLIYICSLFGLIAFYMLLDAAQVIAKRQVITPLIAIGFPFLITGSYFGWRFTKI